MEVFKFLYLFYFHATFIDYFSDSEYFEWNFFAGEAKRSIVAEILLTMLLDEIFDHLVIFGISPRITKREVIARREIKSMSKSQLKAFFALHHSVLLDGLSNSLPTRILLTAENRQMSFFEQFDLITKIHEAKSGCGSRLNSLNIGQDVKILDVLNDRVDHHR